jgi:membrane-associated protease RseP (regulator of RpoE activity)
VRQEATATPAAQTPWLGVAGTAFKDGGVAIKEVEKDGPADKAGLASGDVIKSIDGNEVKDVQALRDAVGSKKVGDEVTLSVVKNGVNDSSAQAKDVKVTLGARPDKHGLRGMFGDKMGALFDRFLGGSFKYLDDSGKTVEIEVVPGTVKSINGQDITVDVNGNQGERKFTLPEAARVPDKLSEGDRVTVVLKDGEVQGVHPGVFGMMGGHGMGLDGLPFFGDGPMHGFGPHGGPFKDRVPDTNQNDNTGPGA